MEKHLAGGLLGKIHIENYHKGQAHLKKSIAYLSHLYETNPRDKKIFL